MKVIAVLDLLDGQVVHGQAGQRSQYEPVESKLIEKRDHSPVDIVRAFRNKLGINNFYIADLNSLTDTGNNYGLISDLAEDFSQSYFYLDAGVKNTSELENVYKLGVDSIIIASETLENLGFLDQLKNYQGVDFTFSLDFNNGQLQTKLSTGEIDGDYLLDYIKDRVFKEVILLDIGNVGTSSGISENIIKLRNKHPYFNYITGGGVRNVEDLEYLQRHNFTGVLIATALHNQKLTRKDIKSIQKPRIAWGITGCGHHLSRITRLIKNLREQSEIDVFVSRAGEDVLKIYNLEIESPVYYDQKASSPPIGRFYHGFYDLLVLAPLTSNSVAKMVQGISDTLITNLFAQAGKTNLPILALPGDTAPELETEAPANNKTLTVYPRPIDLDNTEKLRDFPGVKTLDNPEGVELWIKKYLLQGN